MLKAANNSTVFNVRKMNQPKSYTNILDAAIAKKIEIGATIELASFSVETENNSTPLKDNVNILIPEISVQMITMTDIDVASPRPDSDSLQAVY